MRWLLALLLLAGTRIGALVVGPAPTATPVNVVVPVARMVEPPPPAVPAPLVAPRGMAHAISCGDPKTIGKPIAKLDTELTTGHLHWQVASSYRTCVIAGWTEDELVASYDDGATFQPIAIDGKIQAVAVGDTGTLFVLHADGILDVFHADGTTARRALVWGDKESQLAVRGKWLWLSARVVGNQPSLSPDEGATWIHPYWTQSFLANIVVLDDGTIVGQSDIHGDVCDHFGCGDGPFTFEYETTLAGGPWKPATAAHARAVVEDHANRDRHGYAITRDPDSRYLIRIIGSQYRALYTTRAS